VSGAEYFITLCTHDRKSGLTELAMRPDVLAAMQRLEDEEAWYLHAAVVMPDHVHLLVAIGESVDLAGAVRLFKGRLSPLLRKSGLRWQQAYFDHRMRSEEDRLPVFLYIFLNPYRDGLLPQIERWPGYYCCAEDWAWFGALTSDGSVPVPEWLA
jgi:REP element-mobilizing transposase RayT